MNKQVKKSELVELAQIALNTSIELLEMACQDDSNARAYIIDHLRIMASADHGFLSRDLNLDDLIERYEEDTVEMDSDELEHYQKTLYF
jgi:hypothetical protein